jgi:hypothetical protein
MGPARARTSVWQGWIVGWNLVIKGVTIQAW